MQHRRALQSRVRPGNPHPPDRIRAERPNPSHFIGILLPCFLIHHAPSEVLLAFSLVALVLLFSGRPGLERVGLGRVQHV